MPSTTAEIWRCFAWAATLTTVVRLPLAWVLIRITGVPPTYPPLLPQQIIAGTVGGALLVTLGYWLLSTTIKSEQAVKIIFLTLGILLLIASYHLPYRLSYTTSPRFAGVTVAAQIAQGFLHTVVVMLSMWCFVGQFDAK